MSPESETSLAGVKKILLVLSGKGGVGKSTVSTQLALAYKEKGFKVGLLDIDLCGPSIPHMLNLGDHQVHQYESGWVPVYTDESQALGVMSIGFLLSRKDESVVWRGPKKTAMIKQFMSDVTWVDRDILIIDTPPGTSDEHITVVETIKNLNEGTTSSILVTTPQALAVNDVLREFTFCKKTGIKVLGVIENMSGYVCPNCSECTNIFSSGGGRKLAEHVGIPFLGSIPIDPNLSKAADEGKDFIYSASIFSDIIDKLL